MEFDPVFLARAQFAFTIAFHILFPSLTIGLGAFIFALEAIWLRTGRTVWREMAQFWTRIFALAFGMGVVTGVVLSYQIGTNFSRFADATANVLGPLFGYEVLTAFFLEAGFLGIMLFGWDRVGRRLHLFATGMVAFGTILSAFWILAANSWMQTPAGYHLEDGVFHVESWTAIIFNPSFPYRFFHMVVASFLTGAFVVAAVSAWQLLRGLDLDAARRGLKFGIALAAVLAPLQILIGDLHGLNVREHQPVKLAAMEGLWETTSRAPLLLFAWPDQDAEWNRYEIGIPALGSLILTHDPDGVVHGLKDVPRGDRPYVLQVFWAFRLMVGIGFAMLALAWLGAFAWWRGWLERRRWLLLLFVPMGGSGFLAILSGWSVAESGRQPWVVHGLMRTADAVSPVAAGAIAGSLTAFVLAYSVLLVAWLYYTAKVIARGTHPGHPAPAAQGQRPLAAE
jgi:cytochrome d ubiquinol oxidase subunit I